MVQRQTRLVFRVAYSVLLNAHDAEDAVQETFMKLYRSGGWQNAENERAFLARVAWRTAVDKRRAASRVVLDNIADPAVQPPSAEPSPESRLMTRDQNADLHALIDALPEELRVPLVLGSFDDLNSREIAAILEIPEGTVRTRQQRARQLLRQKLEVLLHAKEAHHA